MKEVWKDINGYEGLYQVSNLGNIKSLKYNGGNKPKNIKVTKTKAGYLCKGLYKNKKAKTFTVHRLDENTFII